jgi:D-sedoheptulose 7-phosphate isomerase
MLSDSDYAREFAEHAEVLDRTRAAVEGPFAGLVEACVAAIAAGHKLLFFGNGGSAADAQHLATELTVRYRQNRPAISAVALTTDTSALTAIGNDFGFDNLFSRQIEALCRKGDVAIGITTSGNSENVVRGLRVAREKGAVTVCLTGGDGGQAVAFADHPIVVPSRTTARIQEMHILLGHMLCSRLERHLDTARKSHALDATT